MIEAAEAAEVSASLMNDGSRPAVTGRVAGWSSLVARRAHNPEVVGSNPTPAIDDVIRWCWSERRTDGQAGYGALRAMASLTASEPADRLFVHRLSA